LSGEWETPARMEGHPCSECEQKGTKATNPDSQSGLFVSFVCFCSKKGAHGAKSGRRQAARVRAVYCARGVVCGRPCASQKPQSYRGPLLRFRENVIFPGDPFTPEHKTPLLQTSFTANVSSMSAVELAVRKVKKLSARQARELLGWLTARQPNGAALKQPARTSRRKATGRRSMQKLKAWQDSIRFTTDWQPPRMPDDLVRSVRSSRPSNCHARYRSI